MRWLDCLPSLLLFFSEECHVGVRGDVSDSSLQTETRAVWAHREMYKDAPRCGIFQRT